MTQPLPEPVWLQARIDQLLAKMEELGGNRYADQTGAEVVMLMLGEPVDADTPEKLARWDRTCDNCGTYCLPHEDFFTGHVERIVHGRPVLISFGICGQCKTLT